MSQVSPIGFLRSGRPSLDLAWTVRFRNVWPTETLVDTDAVSRWLVGTYPEVSMAAAVFGSSLLPDLRALREAVFGLVRSSIDGEAWRPADRAIVNRCAAGPRFGRRLGEQEAEPPTATATAQILAELAVDAVAVLAADRSRLKWCQGPSCSLPFLDESRGGTRRWCTAQRCGNRVNTKAYRSRRRD